MFSPHTKLPWVLGLVLLLNPWTSLAQVMDPLDRLNASVPQAIRLAETPEEFIEALEDWVDAHSSSEVERKASNVLDYGFAMTDVYLPSMEDWKASELKQKLLEAFDRFLAFANSSGNEDAPVKFERKKKAFLRRFLFSRELSGTQFSVKGPAESFVFETGELIDLIESRIHLLDVPDFRSDAERLQAIRRLREEMIPLILQFEEVQDRIIRAQNRRSGEFNSLIETRTRLFRQLGESYERLFLMSESLQDGLSARDGASIFQNLSSLRSGGHETFGSIRESSRRDLSRSVATRMGIERNEVFEKKFRKIQIGNEVWNFAPLHPFHAITKGIPISECIGTTCARALVGGLDGVEVFAAISGSKILGTITLEEAKAFVAGVELGDVIVLELQGPFDGAEWEIIEGVQKALGKLVVLGEGQSKLNFRAVNDGILLDDRYRMGRRVSIRKKNDWAKNAQDAAWGSDEGIATVSYMTNSDVFVLPDLDRGEAKRLKRLENHKALGHEELQLLASGEMGWKSSAMAQVVLFHRGSGRELPAKGSEIFSDLKLSAQAFDLGTSTGRAGLDVLVSEVTEGGFSVYNWWHLGDLEFRELEKFDLGLPGRIVEVLAELELAKDRPKLLTLSEDALNGRDSPNTMRISRWILLLQNVIGPQGKTIQARPIGKNSSIFKLAKRLNVSLDAFVKSFFEASRASRVLGMNSFYFLSSAKWICYQLGVISRLQFLEFLQKREPVSLEPFAGRLIEEFRGLLQDRARESRFLKNSEAASLLALVENLMEEIVFEEEGEHIEGSDFKKLVDLGFEVVAATKEPARSRFEIQYAKLLTYQNSTNRDLAKLGLELNPSDQMNGPRISLFRNRREGREVSEREWESFKSWANKALVDFSGAEADYLFDVDHFLEWSEEKRPRLEVVEGIARLNWPEGSRNHLDILSVVSFLTVLGEVSRRAGLSISETLLILGGYSKWFGSDYMDRSPLVGEIRKRARDLATELMEVDFESRFQISRDRNSSHIEENEEMARLLFELDKGGLVDTKRSTTQDLDMSLDLYREGQEGSIRRRPEFDLIEGGEVEKLEEFSDMEVDTQILPGKSNPDFVERISWLIAQMASSRDGSEATPLATRFQEELRGLDQRIASRASDGEIAAVLDLFEAALSDLKDGTHSQGIIPVISILLRHFAPSQGDAEEARRLDGDRTDLADMTMEAVFEGEKASREIRVAAAEELFPYAKFGVLSGEEVFLILEHSEEFSENVLAKYERLRPRVDRGFDRMSLPGSRRHGPRDGSLEGMDPEARERLVRDVESRRLPSRRRRRGK